MKNKLGVLVGIGIGGQRNIISAISDQGYNVFTAGNIQWPRDHYVHFNKNYVKKNHGVKENPFGDGGYIRTGKGYLLCGTGLADLVPETNSISTKDFLGLNGIEKRKESQTDLANVCKKYFPNTRIHIVPTGSFRGKGHKHLDMSVLLIPNNTLLIADTHFGKFAASGKEIDEIAEREDLKVIRYDGSQDGVWYPLNSLVLPYDHNQDIVFVDDKAKSLIELLKENNVKVVGVPIPQHEYPAGKINCQTNTFNLESNLSIKDLL